MDKFPVGGPRKAVYRFLREHGFMMGRESDKEWHRADGITLYIYGAGSKARVFDIERNVLVDTDIESAVTLCNHHKGA